MPYDTVVSDHSAPTADAPAADSMSGDERVVQVFQLREQLARFMMEYQFGIDEILTKVGILQREFTQLHRYNPIEHVSSRVKTPDSLIEKAVRRGLPLDLDVLKSSITDVAGVRITCSFIADTYRMLETLSSQSDVDVLQVKDYIKNPKPNGYKGLHAIIQVPVFLSSGPTLVTVEVQFRTIAMDFWASLEHKIYYKYQGEVPRRLTNELLEAAQTAEQMDLRMERLHTEVQSIRAHDEASRGEAEIPHKLLQRFWAELPDADVRQAASA